MPLTKHSHFYHVSLCLRLLLCSSVVAIVYWMYNRINENMTHNKYFFHSFLLNMNTSCVFKMKTFYFQIHFFIQAHKYSFQKRQSVISVGF